MTDIFFLLQHIDQQKCIKMTVSELLNRCGIQDISQF